MSEIRTLPEAPSLEHLKHQAKSLHKAILSGDSEALARLRAAHPRIVSESIALADAQLVIAREYGFESWPKLKAHVEAKSLERATDDFKDAVNAGDSEKAGKLLKEHPALRRKIDSPWFAFDTPAIVKAASGNDRPMIDALLAAGANVNARTSWAPGGFGALDNADASTAEYLISRGAYVDIHAAAKLGDLDRVHRLMKADPSLVNARGGDGQTPLHFASTIEICAYLIDHGADIDIRDIDHNSTPAQYSIRNREKLRYLVDRGAKADIFIACMLGDSKLASGLLDKHPDCLRWRLNHPNYQHAAGHIYMYLFSNAVRPITIAADHAGEDFKDFLLTTTQPVDQLLVACAYADSAAVDKVPRQSPGVMASLSPDDQALISDAAWENRLDAIRAMLDAGFDIDARGMEDGTALERAAVRGWAPLVRLLIDRGASLELANKYGGQPLGAAIWGSENWPQKAGDHVGCVKALIDAGAALPNRLWGAPEIREILKQHGVEG